MGIGIALAAKSPTRPSRSPQYERYRALLDEGRADEAAGVLKEIEDYNEYDCRSTRRLRDWLMLGPSNPALRI